LHIGPFCGSACAREEGFTLIELLVVIVIIEHPARDRGAVLPRLQDRANNRAAQADVRAAIPSAEAFYSDQTRRRTSAWT
jgi:Tfp pilus assembly protein PilE